MTIKKSSAENETSPLRTPKAKNKLGLQIRSVPNIRMPHDDLIVSEKPDLKVVENNQEKESTLSSQTSQTTQPSQTSLTLKTDVAPKKNYQKVPNSITKEAIPSGLFKPGKSKHLWDVLYSLTRGAINPTRRIRMSKTKLMKKAAIGSRITFDSCIEHLASAGLLKIQVFTGEHQGNEFEVLLPEEAISLTSQSSHTSQTSPAQNLDGLVILETSQTSHSLNAIESDTSELPKTFFKTNTNDDEAFAQFINIFNDAAVELTGRKLSANDQDKMSSLAELLVLELRTAARRTGSISNVPAFLTEILRRKLLNQPQVKQKTLPDTVGRSGGEAEKDGYEIKSLNEQGRESALAELQEFAGESFLGDFKKWYTPEDWQWLLKNLKEK